MSGNSLNSLSDRHEIRCSWHALDESADELAQFFFMNVDPSYISHSEMWEGRATGPNEWAVDLNNRISQEYTEIISSSSRSKRIGIAKEGCNTIGLVVVCMNEAAKYCVLEDMVIARLWRNSGVGERLLEWVVAEVRSCNIQSMFLESGIGNTAAHRFFQKHGFERCSIVMSRTL